LHTADQEDHSSELRDREDARCDFCSSELGTFEKVDVDFWELKFVVRGGIRPFSG
jgi:hypothetical protein